MRISALFLLISGFSIGFGDTPETACGGRKPFKGKDNSCYDFKQICVKTDDPVCDSFLNSCSQCPADGTTIMKLVDYLNYSKIQSASNMEEFRTQNIKLNVQVGTLKKDLNRIHGKLESIYPTIIVINIITFIIIMVTLVLPKCVKYWRCHKEYDLLDDRHNNEERNLPVVLHSNVHMPNIKFQFNNNTRPVELFVQKTDLIINTKRQICQECPHIRSDDYKIIKLRYNGELLDDNQYLLSCVRGDNVTVDCELDYTVDKRDIIVLQLTGTIPVPQLVQMYKYQTIGDMKKIILRLENVGEYLVFITNKKLQDKCTLDHYNLKDDHIVHVVHIQQRHLIITFVFGNKDPLVVQCRNTDLVRDVKQDISDKLNMAADEFILLSEKEYLREENYIFQYDIANGAEIRCCLWQRLGPDIEKSLVKLEVQCSNIYYYINPSSNIKTCVWTYNFSTNSGIKESKALVHEVNKYLKIKSHPRFMHEHQFFHKDHMFYITVNFMEGKSLIKYAEDNWPLTESKIAKLSYQILDALQHLHQHNLVYRFVNAINMWMEDDEHVKIAAIGFTKYLYGCDARQLADGFVKSGNRKDLCMPPEVNNGGTFEMASDVWQFGSIVYKMVTNRSVYSEMENEEMKRSIETYSNIQYDSSNREISPQLKYFMEQCLKGRPEDRPTVRLLLSDPFIKKYCPMNDTNMT